MKNQKKKNFLEASESPGLFTDGTTIIHTIGPRYASTAYLVNVKWTHTGVVSHENRVRQLSPSFSFQLLSGSIDRIKFVGSYPEGGNLHVSL